MLFSVAMDVYANDTIKVEPESVDVGEIWESESINLSFQVKNVSDTPIQLGKVLKSCSCTDTRISGDMVDPRGKVQLDIRLVRNRPGQFNESVLIRTAEDEGPEKMIKITGKAKPAYIVRGAWELDTQRSMGLETITQKRVYALSDVREGTAPRLLIHIDGLRENDPIAECNSVNVNSSVFMLLQHQLKQVRNGRSQSVLLLGPAGNLSQGLYSDRLEFLFGPDLKVSRRVSFRVIGPVWPERAILNLGAVRAPGKSEKIKLNFQSDVAVWDEIQVVSTDPAEFRKAIVPTNVTPNVGERSVVLNLSVDHDQMATVAKDYFHFTLFLGDKKHIGKPEADKENVPTVKLHVCGIVIGEPSPEALIGE